MTGSLVPRGGIHPIISGALDQSFVFDRRMTRQSYLTMGID